MGHAISKYPAVGCEVPRQLKQEHAENNIVVDGYGVRGSHAM